ncbi:hypothetical protein IAU59_005834 [Kwoniella sp. CBS 9459]
MMPPSSPPLTTALRRTSSPTSAHSQPPSPTLALASASGQLVSPSPPNVPGGLQPTPQHSLAHTPVGSMSLNSPTTEYPNTHLYDNAYTWERANQAVTSGSGSASGSRQPVPRPLRPLGQRPFESPPSPTTPLPNHQSSSKLNGVPLLPIGKTNIFSNPNSSSTKVRTQAEVYADKHSQPQNRRQIILPNARSAPKDELTASKDKDKDKDKDRSAGTKPIFDWIQRKLGARRATISETPSSPKTTASPRARLPSMPKTNERVNNIRAFPGTSRGRGRGRGVGMNSGPGGAGSGFTHANAQGYGMKREDSGGISGIDSRSVSMSLSTRSVVGTVERERRREANNPYPSIPIPRLAAAGMVSGHGQADDATTLSMSMSLSYLSRSPQSRSRSHSLDSLQTDGSRSRRLSMADDTESPIRRFRGRAFADSAVGADDDASLRPFPPSHPASPTPSASVMSRTGSNPMNPISGHQQSFGAIPGPGGMRSRTNTFYSTWSGQGYDRRSYTSSSLDGYAYRPSSAGYPYSIGYGGSRYGEHVNGDDDDNDDDDDEDEARGRESRQDSTSTKPTTCISFDSGPAVGHIAQANGNGTPNDQTPLTPHTPLLGGATVTVTTSPSSIRHASPGHPLGYDSPRQAPRSASPASPASHEDVGGSGNSSPTPPTPTTPTSPISAFPSPAHQEHVAVQPGPSSSYPASDTNNVGDHHHRHLVQAPKHTNPHPVHNPRPSSPPDDNASMLTLASSTFGLISSASPSSALSPGQPSADQSHTPNAVAGGNHVLAQPIHLQPPFRTGTHAGEASRAAADFGIVTTSSVSHPDQGEPDTESSIVFATTPAITHPPSIHRLREAPGRPSSVTAPSIHWAVPASAAEERDYHRPTSTYEAGYPGYAGSTHLSTTAPSVSMSLRQWSLGGDRGMNRADRDASVRAVRRKGSWESYESGWSWRGLSGPASAQGTPTVGESTVTPQTTGPTSGAGWSRGLASPVGPANVIKAQPSVADGDQAVTDAVTFGGIEGSQNQRGSVYVRERWSTPHNENLAGDEGEDRVDQAGAGMIMVS